MIVGNDDANGHVFAPFCSSRWRVPFYLEGEAFPTPKDLVKIYMIPDAPGGIIIYTCREPGERPHSECLRDV
jgi:hypothetical protein